MPKPLPDLGWIVDVHYHAQVPTFWLPGRYWSSELSLLIKNLFIGYILSKSLIGMSQCRTPWGCDPMRLRQAVPHILNFSSYFAISSGEYVKNGVNLVQWCDRYHYICDQWNSRPWIVGLKVRTCREKQPEQAVEWSHIDLSHVAMISFNCS